MLEVDDGFGVGVGEELEEGDVEASLAGFFVLDERGKLVVIAY